MTVHLDTSALVDALAGPRPQLRALIAITERGDRAVISTLVLYEWLRGPRAKTDLIAQEGFFPASEALPFGAVEADLAARLYSRVRRPRGRDFDLAIAACALVHGAALWTLNRNDFKDIPDLRLV